ncbi:Pycsar system effector family protein [Exiguobacterium sp. s133]|uniref:Pycsar system effector family protein n=1 Tax=Exiguobacterium sp. s133 TaxID=2751213 RepID=UPI00203718CD|nr:Pycsar system effector family protein [Exiguobacterium sp. s133]
MEDKKKLKKEDLIQRLDRHLDWIKSCDTKASIVIAGAGIFLSIFTAEHSINMLNQILTQTIRNINFSNFLYLTLFVISWGGFIHGAYCLVRVLVPMMKKEVLIYQQDTRLDSLYYFESIDDKKFLEFKEKMISETPEEEIEDLLTQIYINARICSAKYSFYRRGIRSIFIGISGVLILYTVGIILLKLGGMG